MSVRLDTAKTVLISHRKHLSSLGTRHLTVFGSTARQAETETSDIDLLVDFDATKGLFVFAELKFYLEDILNCKVDLVSERALHPALKKEFSMKQSRPSKNWAFRVTDILHAIDKIESYLEDMSALELKKNELVVDAVIRNFEVIGEASNCIPRSIQQSHPHIPLEANGSNEELPNP